MDAAPKWVEATVGECPSDNTILAFVEAALPADEIARVHDHVDQCDDCRFLLAELGKLDDGTLAASSTGALPPILPGPGVIVGGRYRLERLIGAGGMGAVWAAVHLVTRRPAALKFVKPTEVPAPRALRRFLREARAASAVEHPNIVRILDVFQEGGSPVIVMPLLEGEPLSGLLARRGALPLSEVAALMIPVLSAVAAAHAAGIVHRDLKPDNIFLVRGESEAVDVRVLDFGVAKINAFEGQIVASSTLTRTGEVVGTPHYMSPEQFYGEIDLDARADVWALGVVLYECLSGQRPFSGENLGQILKQVTSGKHVRLDEVAPHLPANVARLVERMLERDRASRPWAHEVASLLERAIPRAVRNPGKPAVESMSRRRARWAARVAGALATASAIGVWALHHRSSGLTTAAAGSIRSADTTELRTAILPSLPIVAEKVNQQDPVGTWRLNCGGYAHVLGVSRTGGDLRATFGDDSDWLDPVDEIAWDEATSTLVFRRRAVGRWQWFVGTLVDGVMRGRFSSSREPQRPERRTSFSQSFTGWREQSFDSSVAAQVFLIDQADHPSWVRVDRTPLQTLLARTKTFSTGARGAIEEPEDDLEVTRWDGTNLTFRRLRLDSTYTAISSGATMTGTIKNNRGSDSWSAKRAEVLSYGLAPRSAEARALWQARARKRLEHLMMANNPAPLSRVVEVVRSGLPPFDGAPSPHRDDDPEQWPQAYRLQELRFTYTLPSPEDASKPLTRRSHAYLAIPTSIPEGKRVGAVLALNDHGGSAKQMMSPGSDTQWYGDSFARRGFVVLALDVSHRDDSPSYKQTGGDDPASGNSAHPSIKVPGFTTSDWEEDGERAWDAMRALDHLLSLPSVDPAKIIVTGLALGGEVATVAAALDPRVSMAIVAGYSPDFGVLAARESHPCWRWTNADVSQYLDASDLFALVAPRPLILETGQVDFTLYSQYPVAEHKQIARRIRAAYGDEANRFVHFLHDDANRYRVGGAAPGRAALGVTTPNVVEPDVPTSRAWQLDSSTTVQWPTIFDAIDHFLSTR